jgi:peptidoglycan/xylan/chitin deacetylase (PgdA/CDA1 family)
VGLSIAAEVLPLVLGPDFAGAVPIARWFSGVALLQGVQSIVANALSGANYRSRRTIISVAGAAGYTIVVAVLGSFYGVPGLIAGTYASQVIMIIGCVVWISRLVRKAKREQTTLRRDTTEFGPGIREVYLNFHGLGPPPPHVDEDERPYWLQPERFEAVLNLVDQWEREERRVFITFDDGNKSDVTIALPVLRQFGRQATFFVLSDRIGTEHYLDVEDIAKLRQAGMMIGSHGSSHFRWTALGSSELKAEIEKSLRVLSAATNQQVSTVAVPFGAYDQRVLQVLGELRVATVFTSDGGLARPAAWVKPRLSVRADTTLQAIEKALIGRTSFLAQLRSLVREWLAVSTMTEQF